MRNPSELAVLDRYFFQISFEEPLRSDGNPIDFEPDSLLNRSCERRCRPYERDFARTFCPVWPVFVRRWNEFENHSGEILCRRDDVIGEARLQDPAVFRLHDLDGGVSKRLLNSSLDLALDDALIDWRADVVSAPHADDLDLEGYRINFDLNDIAAP